LILSHGTLTGGSALTKEYAEGLKRSRLHIDLNITSNFQAALTVANWIQDNEIKVLNVAAEGEQRSKDS